MSSSSSARPPARRGPSGAWSRLRPAAPTDPLDAYGLPSKGETRLHNPQNQEAYYTKIVERYMKFCAATSSAGGEGLEAAFAAISIKPDSTTTNNAQDPSTSTSSSSSAAKDARPLLPRNISETPRTPDLPHILLAMRKLREGILGSRRTDAFAQRSYMFIIQAAILTQSWEAYQPALLYLVYKIHPRTPLSVTELQDYAGYLILDLACRQDELSEALRLKRVFRVKERKVLAVLQSLIHDDWPRFWRLRRAVDGYQRAVMGFGVERMRLHALKCLGRSYLSADKAFVERSADGRWEELVKRGVGWELSEDGSKVVIRRVKAK